MSASIAKTTILGCTLAASSFSYGQSAKEFFTEGDFSFSIRARYEFADFDNRDEGNALTARTLIGYKFAEQSGIGGYVELVNVSAVDQDAYNGIVDGDSSKSIIADPTTSELNQAYVSFKPTEGLLIKGGRQRLIYDNARFIGNVGWRQNEQTFDAVSASYSYEGMKLSYAYLYEINRILADKSDWDSDSHLINLTYKGLENITFGAYGYFLDFDGTAPAANDTDTFGAYVAGSHPTDSVKIGYRAEYARQESDTDIETDYAHLMLSGSASGITVAVGYELLGSDDGAGRFVTPLATAHAFNGWADAYLNNGGAGGLENYYISIAGKIGPVPVKAIYHNFSSDEGSLADGDEIDLLATYKINENVSTLFKAAFYEGDNLADRNRFWAQIQFTY
ncbi:MAG: alginate export family protein [Opitutales bacterium]|nr:alginate export family protein [Opitutales bacterium]